ncbi:MAG: Spx/MgsR family RNA polymerase-binding regulatory protein [Chitinophagaceae bacterium]|nr:Spx/MgsR family RNA polymerase-binding regulatory protein [Chitinophagaceae bacterium]
MIEVYGITNCNTVKKAVVWLKEHSLPYRFHDYKKEGITEGKMDAWCHYFGWENLVNKAGTTWKKLPDDVKATIVNQPSAIQLMLNQNSVIKRPVIEAGKKLLIRFNEEEYKILLPKK